MPEEGAGGVQVQHEFLNTVLESLTHPFYVIDANDYTVLIANSAARMSLSEGESTCYALTHHRNEPCNTGEHPCPLQEVKRTRKPVTVEHIHCDEDGNLRNVEVHAHPIFDKDGNVAQVIEYSFDITEREKAEEAFEEARHQLEIMVEERTEALQHSRNKYKSFFQNAKNGAAIYRAEPEGIDFVFIDLNAAAEEILKSRRDHVVGRRVTEVIPRIKEFGLLDVLQKVWRTGKPEVFPVRKYLDGDLESWTENSIYKLPSGEIVVIFSDETERKRSEQVRLESERRLRTIAETITEVFWMADPQISTMLYASPAYEKVWGRSVASLYEDPKSFIDAIHEEDRERVLANLEIKKAGNPFYDEYRIIRPDGTIRWIWDRGFPVQDETGEVTRYVGVALDVTDRKKAEEALDRANQEWERTFNAISDGIMVLDDQHKVIRANKAMAETFGMTERDLIGRLCFELVHGEKEPPAFCPHSQLLTDGEEHSAEVMEPRLGATLDVRVSPVLDQNGQVRGSVHVIRDITERKLAEELIRIRLDLLEYSATHSLEELLQKTLDEIGRLTSSPIGFYHFVSEDEKTIYLQMWSSRTLKEFCTAEGKGQHYPVEQAGVWADAIRERRSLMHNDYSSLPHRKEMPEGHAIVIRELVVPIMRSNRIVAVLGIGNKPRDYSGKDIEVVSYLADVAWEVAQRKRAEEALRQSEQQFRAIFEGAEDYIFLKDRSLRYVQVNPAFERLAGVPASQIIGKMHEDVLGKDASELIREKDLRTLAGETMEDEYGVTHRGIPMYFLATRTPLRDPSGETVGILVILHDITDRKRTEEYSSPEQGEYPSKSMRTTLKQAKIAARKASTILLTGESGSGKDHLAKYIHNHSDRAKGPYFSINCAAIAPDLAESELFGHERGAFTGAVGRKRGLLELAEGGTILLNEIGELSVHLQAKLLTFLDTRKFTRVGGEKEISVNARLIAATNRDLEKALEEGGFRKDLFYRLNVVSIPVPPLRERLDDIPLLVQEMLAKIHDEMPIHEMPVIDAGVIDALKRYDWPGNVRELRNVLERAVIHSGGEPIGLGHLGLKGYDQPPSRNLLPLEPVSLEGTLRDCINSVAKAKCVEALRLTGGNKKFAAHSLGISRDSLYRYMETLEITKDDYM
jgi:PAS domain S-box-containing protein